MNTRRGPFADIRVRDALMHAFNFESINDTMTGGRQPRITSYFSNSVLGMQTGPATGRVADLLVPFAADLPVEALEGYQYPQSDGSLRNRRNIRRAMKLLQDAGWDVVDGVMLNAQGTALDFNILLRQGSKEQQGIASIFIKALERLGITATIETVDNAQFVARLKNYDFDMTWKRWDLSLSPGNEQRYYWGAQGVTTPGTRNYMGMDVSAAEAMIDHMLTSRSHYKFVAAVRALDRILTSGRYVIPIYQYSIGRIAHDKALHFPKTLPIYGDRLVWMPEVWWYEDKPATE
jgi:peptide/nickel transport system substrate-binding protein